MKKKWTRPVYLVIFLMITAGIISCAASKGIQRKHPEEVTELPMCSDCHGAEKQALNHTSIFSTRHKIYASRQIRVCNMCHKKSFCSDCHAHKEEISPVYKFKDSPRRFFPHRGNYQAQHKIDGRVNPGVCAKCHGRQNNERCMSCHK